MDREKIIKELEERIKVAEECMENPMFTPDAIRTIVALLNEQENCENCAIAIEDRQPIVRCKECKHGEPGACGDGVDCDGVWHDDEWFCADGERRTDDA